MFNINDNVKIEYSDHYIIGKVFAVAGNSIWVHPVSGTKFYSNHHDLFNVLIDVNDESLKRV